ncbi:MAG: hypothetical protein HC786_23850 [Richelia sp. CSU_2_1]|nr:hypothetical protein [Richelia sp. CSU_2_1]
MWGCQSESPLPEPDPQFLYKVGDAVINSSGETIGIVVEIIDRTFTDGSGKSFPHLSQGRSEGEFPELGKYPSYLLYGPVSGRTFEWTQRDRRLFAKYSQKIQEEYEKWLKKNEAPPSSTVQE